MKAKTMRILATAIVLVTALGGLMYTSLAKGPSITSTSTR